METSCFCVSLGEAQGGGEDRGGGLPSPSRGKMTISHSISSPLEPCPREDRGGGLPSHSRGKNDNFSLY
jgi:hypothetical protein